MKSELFFLHGNGFPAPSYQKFLQPLAQFYRLSVIDRLGHNQQFPVTDNWPHLVDEVLATIRKEANSPVIALGHSLGGILSLMASVKAPELFKAVIMLDSPILSSIKSSGVLLAKRLGLIDRLTPAQRTRRRCEFFDSSAAFEEYCLSKPVFLRFDKQCLKDYMSCAIESAADGRMQLRFDRAIEYQIYRTLPHNLPHLRDKLTVPLGMVYGLSSDIVTAHDRCYAASQFPIKLLPCEGGHLFPLEHPLAAGKVVQSLIHSLCG